MRAVINAAQNLAQRHIASGFGFWNNTAGFDISQTLIAYSSSTSTFGRAFWVGLLNTLLVAGIGIVLATVLGFVIGIARLSRNWLVSRFAGGYVELIRNVPLLLQLLFWYNAVLKSLPELRGSVALPGGGILNNRGLFLPRPEFAEGFGRGRVALAVRGCWRRSCCASGRAGVRSAPAQRCRTPLDRARPDRRPAACRVYAVPAVRCRSAFRKWAASMSCGGVEILPEFAALLVRADDLHGGFHRRGGARRHARRTARPDRSGAGARAAVAARCCGLSSFPRRCG